MRKVLFFVMIMAVLVMANDSRVASLGGSSVYYLDDTQIFENPAHVTQFGNGFVIEAGTYHGTGSAYGQSAYGMAMITEQVYIGAGIMRGKDDFDMIGLPSGLSAPTNELDIILGYDAGDIKFGLGTHFAGNKSKMENDETTTDKTSVMAFNLGAVYGDPDDMMAEGNLEVRMNSYAVESGTPQDISGGMGIKFQGRGFIPVGQMQAVAGLQFNTFSYTPAVDGTDGNKVSSMDIGVALGAKVPVLDEGFITPGLGVYMGTSQTEDVSKSTTTIMPELYVAGELPLKDWCTVRMAYRRFFGSEKYESLASGSEYTETETLTMQPDQVTLGAGFNLLDGMVSIDGFVGEEFVFGGGYLVSGNPENLFGSLSLSVYFE